MSATENTYMSPSSRSILVVSDLHLGGEQGEKTSVSFIKFIDWISRKGDLLEISSNGTINRTVQCPSLIILLGDIMELWVPRSEDRSSVLQDLIPVVEALQNLGIEVVYVTGNHDHEVDELKSFYPAGKIPLTIMPRHYPAPVIERGVPVHNGIPAGDHRYVFMHGHQFDMIFNGFGILQEYPGWVANVESIFREHPAVPETAQGVIGLMILYLMATIPSGTSVPFIGPLLTFFTGVASIIVLMSLPTDNFKQAWTALQSRLKKSAKGKGVYTLIDEEYWKKDLGKNIGADTIIFGHTHVPEDTKDRFAKDIGKRFVNCGSWVPVPPPQYPAGLPYYYNTFVVLDDNGPALLWWNDDESRIYELVSPAEAEPGTTLEIDRAINRYFYSVK